MPSDPKVPDSPAQDAGESRPAGTRTLPPAAQRALAEAAARRAERASDRAAAEAEAAGRGGLDPTRYGDWEINGLAADF
jgi:hypothetical protein